jgi:hypothetical protein
MLFASDSPFDPGKGPGYIRATIESIESLGLSDAEGAQLHEGNAHGAGSVGGASPLPALPPRAGKSLPSGGERARTPD